MTMSFNEFIAKWDGKHCEVAGSSNAINQCVDLANAYIREVLGKPIIEWTDAKDFPSRVNPNDYDFIPNPKLTVPAVGDIVVWSTNHIAICTYSDIDIPWFTSFDQNWPTGSVCHKVDHSYNNVAGWLHPKGQNLSDNQEVEQLGKQLEDCERQKREQTTNLQEQVNGLIQTIKDLKEDYATNIASITKRLEQEEKLHQGFLEDMAMIYDCEATVPAIQSEAKSNVSLQDQLTTCTNNRRDDAKEIGSLKLLDQSWADECSIGMKTTVATPAGVKRGLASFLKASQTNPSLDSYSAYDLLLNILGRMTSWLKRK